MVKAAQLPGSGRVKNVGQVVFMSVEDPEDTALRDKIESLEWSIGGTTVLEYEWFSPYEIRPFEPLPDRVDNSPPVASERKIVRSYGNSNVLAWVWKDPGRYTVTVTGRDKDGKSICAASPQTFEVERNKDDPDRQAEDFFTSAPGSIVLDAGRLRGYPENIPLGHRHWHLLNDLGRTLTDLEQGGIGDSNFSRRAAALFRGEEWLAFHRGLVYFYETWREFFGYPPLEPWDPAGPFPERDSQGYLLNDATRSSSAPNCGFLHGPGCAVPPWFTAAGRGIARTEADGLLRVCHALKDYNGDGRDTLVIGYRGRNFETVALDPVGPGQRKLDDFVDSRALGCVLSESYHSQLHAAVGGSMADAARAVKDPLFWRFHKFLTGGVSDGNASIWEEFQRVKAARGGAPVVWNFPPRLQPLANLDRVTVGFAEPVTGVDAADLLINGSPAGSVRPIHFNSPTSAAGASGPAQAQPEASVFEFSALPAAGSGRLQVEIRPGSIRGRSGSAFAGDSWSYQISPDADGDGWVDPLDNCPTVANPDQANSSETHLHGGAPTPEGMERLLLRGDPRGDACRTDMDGDGLDDDIEVALGTDPHDPFDPDGCPDDPDKKDPGLCGCGFPDDDLDGNGTLDCRQPAGPWLPHRLRFAQFADGGGIFSQILLFSLSGGETTARIFLKTPAGSPLSVDLNGQTVKGDIEVKIPASGVRILKTDGVGAVQSGSVTVRSDHPLAGVILFGGVIGLAGVGSSPTLNQGFLAPMEVDKAKGINTGVAFMNLEPGANGIELELLGPDAKSLAKARLSLDGSGQKALFVDQVEWDRRPDLSTFQGLLRAVSEGRIAATAIQLRPGEFATLPVASSLPRPVPPAGSTVPLTPLPAGDHRLYIAQFGDGQNLLFSQIQLFNLEDEKAKVTVHLRDGQGRPLTVDLNGRQVPGKHDLEIAGQGLAVLKTDGRGPLTVGSVTVQSERRLAGVVIFGGALGTAGVGSSLPLPDGFLAPMEVDTAAGLQTGVALVNLESVAVEVFLRLVDSEGREAAAARLTLPPQGHLARFLTEFSWDRAVSFQRFTGLLQGTATGRIASTVLQTRPGQLATMPVAVP